MPGITATKFIDDESLEAVHSAINLYNDIRTTLEENGWTRYKTVPNSTYWWSHPDHPHSHSMSAAFGIVVLKREIKKALEAYDKENSSKP